MSKITTNELAKYAVDQLEAGTSSSLLALRLSALLVEERRSRDVPTIMRAIDQELSSRGSDQVVITAAHETSQEVKKQISELLGVKNPIFSEVIDPSVIGGVKAESGEKQIDLTVQAKLQRFKAAVMRSN